MGGRLAVGVLGAGQLARMTCEAARDLGFRTHVYAGRPGEPAEAAADRVWVGRMDDWGALGDFAGATDFVTYDTELLPVSSVRFIADRTAVWPDPDLLARANNRIREREWLRGLGIPMPGIAVLEDVGQVRKTAGMWTGPGILKTAEQGYDGKGQISIEGPGEIEEAFLRLGGVPCVLEEKVSFEREMSVIVAGAANGELAAYPAIDNLHRRHVLHRSDAPSTLAPDVARRAEAIALRVAAAAKLRGLLAVEMFHARDGRVLVNELAPRPHNSGHHTQLSAETSQFHQLVRAISGMTLGSTAHRPSVMINLLGDLFQGPSAGDDFARGGFSGGIVRDPVRQTALGVYFYGKREARPGRKLGHVIAVADSLSEAGRLAQERYESFLRGAGREESRRS